MPHLIIEYSANLSKQTDLSLLCSTLRDVMVATELFPLKGTRVRCLPCPHYSIADDHPDNAFAAMILRIGAGRTTKEIQAAAASINDAAVTHFQPLLDAGTFMLSLDVQINNPELSWKTNGIAKRLAIR